MPYALEELYRFLIKCSLCQLASTKTIFALRHDIVYCLHAANISLCIWWWSRVQNLPCVVDRSSETRDTWSLWSRILSGSGWYHLPSRNIKVKSPYKFEQLFLYSTDITGDLRVSDNRQYTCIQRCTCILILWGFVFFPQCIPGTPAWKLFITNLIYNIHMLQNCSTCGKLFSFLLLLLNALNFNCFLFWANGSWSFS